MKPTPELIKDLKRDEGLRLVAYGDPLTKAEPWTIGYGHTGPDVKKGTVWTKERCEEALIEDIPRTCLPMLRDAPWITGLDPVRQDVLYNMAYNMGWNPRGPRKGLAGFTNTLALIQKGQYARAARNMLMSDWASQVGNRATRLAYMMREGKRL